MSINNAVLSLIEYADEMAQTGRLKDEISLFPYYQQIGRLSACFRKSFLEFNVGKTKVC